MDVVLPPGSHPYPEADLPEIPPEGGSTRYLCKGTREGKECGLPKMFPGSKCGNSQCSKHGETRKRDSYADARKSSGNILCNVENEDGEICGYPKPAPRSKCTRPGCKGTTKYGKRKKRKGERPPAEGPSKVDLPKVDSSSNPFSLENFYGSPDEGKLKSKKKTKKIKKKKKTKKKKPKKRNRSSRKE